MSRLEAQLHVVADKNRAGKPLQLNQHFFQFGFFGKQEDFPVLNTFLFFKKLSPAPDKEAFFPRRSRGNPESAAEAGRARPPPQAPPGPQDRPARPGLWGGAKGLRQELPGAS